MSSEHRCHYLHIPYVCCYYYYFYFLLYVPNKLTIKVHAHCYVGQLSGLSDILCDLLRPLLGTWPVSAKLGMAAKPNEAAMEGQASPLSGVL